MISASGWIRSRYPHAAAAGALLALAFPNVQIAGLAWVAPALILGIAFGTDLRQSFRLGYVAGLAFHLVSLNWLLLIPVTFFPILGWLALSAYLSLYTAVWTSAACCLWPTPARIGIGVADSSGDWPNWGQRATWALAVATLWVGLEMIRARLLGGFPWNPLGASQVDMIPLIQVARFTGVYGISFLVVWLSAGLLCAGLALLRTQARRSAWLADVALPLLAVAVAFAWGLHTLRTAPAPDRSLRVAVVQPSIPQTDIWDPTENQARFDEVLRLSQLALGDRPDLLLWPEAAVPELLRWDEPTYSAITNLAASNQVWMILGADDAIPGDTREDEVLYYNSAWLMDPDGCIRDTYRKQQLVAFGEEVPFSRWLPFLKWFTPITGSFTPGSGFVPFLMDSLDAETTTLICFEDVFPHLVRRGRSPTTDFLVNLTNDGWFREGSAQRQQAVSAAFRAVENGVPLIRCTNNGMTCWVDPWGRVVESFRDDSGTIYGPGWTVFTVSWSTQPQVRDTLYSRHGDLFGWACIAIGASQLLIQLIRRRSRAAA
jgi:apolipoprotein N-acyltransferase